MADDFDDDYLAAARRAAQLRGAGPPARPRPQLAIPVRAATVVSKDFSLEPVNVGWRVWSKSRFVNTDPDFPDPVGGMCVEVIHDQWTDDQTGEIVAATRYRCLATWRPPPFREPILEAAEVDTTNLGGLDRAGAFACVRELVRPIATGKKKAPTATDLRAWTDANRLMIALT